MITDALMILEENMAMPNGAETHAANPLDMQRALVAGSGKLFVVGLVTADMAAGTNLCMKVYSDDTNGATTLVYTGEIMLEAAVVKGVVLGCFALPPDVGRYVGASLTEVGGAATGKVSLFITNHPVATVIGANPIT